jgi:hypothetical protein
LWAETGSAQVPLLRKNVTLSSRKQTPINYEYKLDKQLRDMLLNTQTELKLRAEFKALQTSSTVPPTIRYVEAEEPFEWLSPSLLEENDTTDSLTLRLQWKCNDSATVQIQIENQSAAYDLTSPSTINLVVDTMDKIYEVPIVLNKSGESPKSTDHLKVSLTIGELLREWKVSLEPSRLLFLENPVSIDGRDDEWKNLPRYSIEGTEHIVHGLEAYGGEDDISGQFSIAWDSEGLYLLVTVKDDSILNRFATENPWTGDAVELFMDFRHGEDLGKPSYDEQVFQVFFVPPDKYRKHPVMKIWQPEGTTWENCEYAFTEKPGRGYTLEVKIAWKDIGIEEISSSFPFFGFELTLDDIDPGDYEHKQLIWRGGVNNWRDPSLFSQMQLCVE